MKRIALALVALLLATGAYFIASPYWTLSGLRDAIEARDTESLETRVDFPALRESVAAEINAQLRSNASEEMAGNPFGALAIGLASKVVEGVVDVIVTPTGLARLASGEGPVEEKERPAPEDEPETRDDLFANARLEHEGLDRFSVWVPNEDGEQTRFVFRRRGLGWVLTSVELPDFDF